MTGGTQALSSLPPWTFEPAVVIGLVATAIGYAAGLRSLWGNAGRGRGVTRLQAIAFAVGWVVLLFALTSPLHELGESLFAAHMVQHQLLMVVAAPLMVLGRPLIAFVWAVPVRWRRGVRYLTHAPSVRRTWSILRSPVLITGLQAMVIWGWHSPALYDAAVKLSWVHAVQHTSFLGIALLFWWQMLERSDATLPGWLKFALLIATAIQTGVLGALLTFAPQPLFSAYGGSDRWGFTALEDQQLAGLIMWVPGGIAYLATAVIVATRWFGDGRSLQPQHRNG